MDFCRTNSGLAVVPCFGSGGAGLPGRPNQRVEKAIGLASNNAELRDYLLNRKEFVLRGTKEAGQTGPAATQP